MDFTKTTVAHLQAQPLFFIFIKIHKKTLLLLLFILRQAWAANNNQYFIRNITTFPACLVATETENNENTSFSIYPNPNNGFFTIETTENGTLDCFDALGKLIFTQKINQKSDFSMENTTNGVYFLRLTTAKGVEGKVFVKK